METRRAPRVGISLKVTSKIDEASKQKFSLSTGKTFEVDAKDISILGVGVYSKFFLPRQLLLELQISGKPFGLGKNMVIKGEVRYCKYTKPSAYRCGIKFLHLSGEYKDKITNFIATYERKKSRLKLSE